MENVIQGHKDFVKSQIEKSFGVENDIEKARNVGDVHPNGKWVCTEYAPGKFDWRSKKTRANAQLSGHKPGETKSAAKSNSEAAKKVLYFLQLSNSKFNDITKVGALKTDTGNWRLFYDGHDVCIVGGHHALSEKTLKDAGVKIEEKKVDKNAVNSTSNNTQKGVRKKVNKRGKSLSDISKFEINEDFLDGLSNTISHIYNGFSDRKTAPEIKDAKIDDVHILTRELLDEIDSEKKYSELWIPTKMVDDGDVFHDWKNVVFKLYKDVNIFINDKGDVYIDGSDDNKSLQYKITDSRTVNRGVFNLT